jgi:hypothetical protein
MSSPSAAAARAAAGGCLAAERTRTLSNAVLLLLALRLERKGSEHYDAIAFLQPAHDFSIIEVALAKLHDSRLENRVCAVRDEDESSSSAPRSATKLG